MKTLKDSWENFAAPIVTSFDDPRMPKEFSERMVGLMQYFFFAGAASALEIVELGNKGIADELKLETANMPVKGPLPASFSKK